MKGNLKKFNKKALWWTGSLLLIVPAFAYAYFLMPFPGSQDYEALEFSYYLEKMIPAARIPGVLLLAGPVLYSFFYGTLLKRFGNVLWCLLLASLFYFTDFVFNAAEMFKEPSVKKFLNSSLNKVPLENLIIGIENYGEAKAFPVNFIGYHHKVQDSVGGKPVLVTYCTMCRTGRVYSPLVKGKYQQFRLVGARHYNAVIEDNDTRTWWYQATGEAAAGSMKGKFLEQIPFEQMTLKSWLKKHPESLIMQPDSNFSEEYADLKEYDRKPKVEKDSLWQRKSWVIGITVNKNARAYEWKDILKHKLINDKLDGTPLLLFLENDNFSFHSWSRKVNDEEILFEMDSLSNGFKDVQTHSTWNADGSCIEGFYLGKKLQPIQSYQEYWHSWKYFHPEATKWNPF